MDEDVNAFFVADDDIGPLVLVYVARHHLGAYAGIIINQIRDEIHSIFAAHGLEPIDNGGGIWFSIAVGTMGPPAFASDDVLDAVVIHIDEVDGVELGEFDAVFVALGLVGHDDVLFEGDFAILGNVLVPGEAEAVGSKAGEDVVIAVAIEIIGVHLGTAGAAELEVVFFPGVAGKFGGLFPPAIFFEDIHAAVAVDVAVAHAVGEFLPAALGGDGGEIPDQGGVIPIGGGVTEIAAGVADDLGFAIAGEVAKGGGFVVSDLEGDVLFPFAGSALGVFEPPAFLTGEAEDEDIGPGVLVKIVG